MEQTETNNYYNAKPSKISNIGKDVSGAKRMNFNTYETTEERIAREYEKSVDKSIQNVKKEIKAILLSDSPNPIVIIDLLNKEFELKHGFSYKDPNSRSIIQVKRNSIANLADSTAFNKLVGDYNKLKKTIGCLQDPRYLGYYMGKMIAKYHPKKTFTESNGKYFNWKDFIAVTDLNNITDYINNNSSAVQFGNSVTDKERGYILSEMSVFIKIWNSSVITNKINITPINWSFGARGKAGSVAYYQRSNKVISVNRNNIGSLIHELGHFIDDTASSISNSISYETIRNYKDKIKEGLDSKSLSYYCKRSEIFARAFEAYCLKSQVGFNVFAQAGLDYLPDLNPELISLIEKALDINR